MGRSMRLVVLNYVFDPRIESPERLLEDYDALTGWCRAARDAGMQVRIVQAFTRSAVLMDDGVEWVFCAASASRERWGRRMHTVVASLKPDVVHVNGLDAPLQMWLLRRALPTSAAIVAQDHGGAPPRGRLKRVVKRGLMRAADGYLFTSASLAEPWIQRGFISKDAVHEVLAASTSLRPMDQATARRVTGMVGTPALLWVARLHPNKDPLTILDGFERVALRLPGATLTMIYQDAELLSAVEQRLARSDVLRDRVRLVGRVPHDELAAWYSAADMFVIGSANEVCGYAAVEACACGAIPVLTDIPSFRVMTGNGVVGHLWRRGDAESLADALVAASKNVPSQRARVRKHFAAHLSWSAVGQRARAVYESVVATRRGLGRHAP